MTHELNSLYGALTGDGPHKTTGEIVIGKIRASLGGQLIEPSGIKEFVVIPILGRPGEELVAILMTRSWDGTLRTNFVLSPDPLETDPVISVQDTISCPVITNLVANQVIEDGVFSWHPFWPVDPATLIGAEVYRWSGVKK